MRINYTDDEDFPGQFELWDANCNRSVSGRAGQAALRELEAALLALPRPRLINDAMADDKGEVCAVGALVLGLRVKAGGDRDQVLAELQRIDPEDPEATEAVAVPLGVPRLVAWKLVAQNDLHLEHVTPEDRYTRVLEWVRSRLRP